MISPPSYFVHRPDSVSKIVALIIFTLSLCCVVREIDILLDPVISKKAAVCFETKYLCNEVFVLQERLERRGNWEMCRNGFWHMKEMHDNLFYSSRCYWEHHVVWAWKKIWLLRSISLPPVMYYNTSIKYTFPVCHAHTNHQWLVQSIWNIWVSGFLFFFLFTVCFDCFKLNEMCP